jgi:hypothetical protein
MAYKIALFALLMSCISPPKDPSKIGLKYDLDIVVNGQAVKGLGAVKSAKDYEIKFPADPGFKFAKIANCHREQIYKLIYKGFFDKDDATIHYFPIAEIEFMGGCPMVILAYNDDENFVSGAILDFETKEETLTSIIRCNGKEVYATGVGVCQSNIKLVQEIEFYTDVEMSSVGEKCKTEAIKSGNKVEFSLKPGLCVYVFYG